jgi:hypothetical protein
MKIHPVHSQPEHIDTREGSKGQQDSAGCLSGKRDYCLEGHNLVKDCLKGFGLESPKDRMLSVGFANLSEADGTMIIQVARRAMPDRHCSAQVLTEG